jgi:hypothetical protein
MFCASASQSYALNTNSVICACALRLALNIALILRLLFYLSEEADSMQPTPLLAVQFAVMSAPNALNIIVEHLGDRGDSLEVRCSAALMLSTAHAALAEPSAVCRNVPAENMLAHSCQSAGFTSNRFNKWRWPGMITFQ